MSDESPDLIAASLSELRARNGAPSYAEIARRISRRRQDQQLASSSVPINRSTIYDAFRSGRRRLDHDLVLDIVTALGGDDDELEDWGRRLVQVRMASQRHFAAAEAGAPRRPEMLIAREGLLQLVTAGAHHLVVGAAGIGKSAFIAEATHRLIDAGASEGAVVINLRGFETDVEPVGASAALAGLLQSVGVASPPVRHLERLDALDERLAEKRWVIILENVASEAQVRSLLPFGGGTTVFITTRNDLALDGVQRIDIGRLSVEESLSMFAAIVGADRIAEEPAAAAGLAELGAGLPLGIAIMASRAASPSGWSLEEHLIKARSGLNTYGLDRILGDSIASTAASAGDAAFRVLVRAADHPFASLDVDAIAALADLSPEATAEALATLAGLQLVTLDGSRVTMHDTVRAYARRIAHDQERPGAKADSMARLRIHLLEHMWGALEGTEGIVLSHWRHAPEGLRPHQFSTQDDRATWLRENAGVLLELARVDEMDHPDTVAQVSNGLSVWLNHAGRFRDGVSLHRTALDLALDQRDARAVALAREALGTSYMFVGHVDDALANLELAARDFDALGETAASLETQGSAAVCLMEVGRLTDALERSGPLAARLEAIGSTSEAAACWQNRAVMLSRLGRFEESVEACAAALALLSDEDRTLRVAIGVNLADALLMSERFVEALQHVGPAIEVANEIRYAAALPTCHAIRGAALIGVGCPTDAAESLAAARASADLARMTPILARILRYEAALEAALGRPDVAIAKAEEAVRVAGGASPVHRAQALVTLADVSPGGSAEQRKALAEAADLFEESGSQLAVGVRERVATLARPR